MVFEKFCLSELCIRNRPLNTSKQLYSYCALEGKHKKEKAAATFRVPVTPKTGNDMGRWLKPDVYPLIAAMSLVTGMCVFQLARNVFLNPDVRISKSNRQSAVAENAEEGESYSQHAFRRFLSSQRPEVFPAINRFFSESGGGK